MNIELISILIILAVVWIALSVLDVIVAGLLALCLGLSFKKAFLWGLLSLAVPVLMVIYGVAIEKNWYKVNKVELQLEGLPEAFDGYRLVQLSDIHSRSFMGRPKTLRRAVDKVNGLGADLVVFTGDIITMTADELDTTGPILSGLHAPDGVMSVLGNHDYGIYAYSRHGGKRHHGAAAPDKNCAEDVAERERAMGWDILLDENRIIRRGSDALAVIGVQNTSPSRHFPSHGDLAKASAGTDGLFRILLTHDPMHWDAGVVGHDYPLTLSGHTHAIQLSLFGWCPSRYIFKQYRGLYSVPAKSDDKAGQAARQYLYVNIGLGETIIPLRIGTRPEITLITLRHS